MAWKFNSIMSTQPDPSNESTLLVEVKFDYETEETEKNVIFGIPMGTSQEDIQGIIGRFLVMDLNLFTKITKDDINVGYKSIMDLIAGIDSIQSRIQTRLERASDTLVTLNEEAALLAQQRDVLTRIVGYLAARAV